MHPHVLNDRHQHLCRFHAQRTFLKNPRYSHSRDCHLDRDIPADGPAVNANIFCLKLRYYLKIIENKE